MKIFINTVKRPNSQITLASIPKQFLKNTHLVVQHWEKDEYKQYENDVNIVVLPNTDTYNRKINRAANSMTRLWIYTTYADQKVLVVDDDLLFGRSNRKYFVDENKNKLEANFEGSSRKNSEEDMIEMISYFDTKLDDKYTMCGPRIGGFPPGGKMENENACIYSAFFVDTGKLKEVVSKTNVFEKCCIGEDVVLNALLFKHGHFTLRSNEFFFTNMSVQKDLPSECWDGLTNENYDICYNAINEEFPGLVTMKVGFRNKKSIYVNTRKIKSSNSKKEKSLL